MYYDDAYIMSSGVILSRKLYGENTYYITLFLKQYGIMNVTVPSRSYPGEREPLIWAVFKLRKKLRSRNYFIEDTDIKDDMLAIRKSREQILTALKWCRLITKYLEPSQPDDALLNNLYWNMKLLCEIYIPPEALNWRFIWQWLSIWGLAPDINTFLASKRFTQNETALLSFIVNSNTKMIMQFFSEHKNIPAKIFSTAFDLSLRLLNEK